MTAVAVDRAGPMSSGEILVPESERVADIELKQLWCLVNKTCRAVSIHKRRMIHHLGKEWDVRLHAADSEFLQSAVHAMDCIDEATSASCHFGQQGIIKRIHYRPGKRAAGINHGLSMAHGIVFVIVRRHLGQPRSRIDFVLHAVSRSR